MNSWWNHAKKWWQHPQRRRPLRRAQLFLESLERREVPSASPAAPPSIEGLLQPALLSSPAQPAGLTVAPGYSVSVFATGPNGATQPDSIAVDGANVYVGYQNHAAKDGSQGSSTIVQFTPTGPNGTWVVAQTWSVAGHNDGLKVDPRTHLVWALQNEDANPTLVVIDPNSGTTTPYTMTSVNHGGGFDDIAFVHGKVFMTASNPTNNPNTDPAVVQVTLDAATHTANTTPVLFGNATAFNLVTHQFVELNLQDPDSMTVDPHGNLLFTDQADNQLVTVHHPGRENQFVTVLPLSDAANNPVSVDDTLFDRRSSDVILMTDQTTGIIYQVTVPSDPHAFSAAQDIGVLGITNLKTGLFTPVISGLGSPRGLALLNVEAFEHPRDHDVDQDGPRGDGGDRNDDTGTRPFLSRNDLRVTPDADSPEVHILARHAESTVPAITPAPEGKRRAR